MDVWARRCMAWNVGRLLKLSSYILVGWREFGDVSSSCSVIIALRTVCFHQAGGGREIFIWFYGFSTRPDDDDDGDGAGEGVRAGKEAMNGKCLFIEYGLMLNYEQHKFCQFTEQNAFRINEQWKRNCRQFPQPSSEINHNLHPRNGVPTEIILPHQL